MSARHLVSRPPNPIRRHLRVTLPIIIAMVAAMVVIADVAVTRRDNSTASADPTRSVLGPTITASTTPTQRLKAGAATPAGPLHPAAAAPARIESPPGGDAAAEVTALTADLGSNGVSVAALNLSTGASFTFGATAGMTMGSIAKLDILETLLLQHQDSLTTLSDDDVSLATSMIEQSDNDAADALWAEIGSDPAVGVANQRLGVPTLSVGTDGYWGLGTTSATEQLTLLKNLVVSGGPLDTASQAFALGLMHGVEADQRWGVGTIADSGTDFANKNGWLANDSDNDLWLINSDGIVAVHGQQVLISVLTQHDQSEQDGIDLVEQIATAVAPTVSS